MDIVRVIRLPQLKATFQALALKQKFFLIIFLFSLIATLMPHQTNGAFLIIENYKPVLVFDVSGRESIDDYLVQISQDASDRYYRQQLGQQAMRQALLTQKVQEYLANLGSPLAEHAPTLITLRNWKKIIALANAESSLCRKYPVHKANCWGVGGSNLWDMGDNLDQGIIGMNNFLNHYPKGSVKYSQMSFERMNGFYKQPAADHWLANNLKIYQELSAIESSI